MNHFKKIAVSSLIVFNILLAGAAVGSYLMHKYDAQVAVSAQHVAQELLKSVPAASTSKN
jgi:hypothetical protein